VPGIVHAEQAESKYHLFSQLEGIDIMSGPIRPPAFLEMMMKTLGFLTGWLGEMFPFLLVAPFAGV
jgi:hypothetical protein